MNIKLKEVKEKVFRTLVILLTTSTLAIGQCNVYTIPYINYFSPNTNALACWNDTLGTLTPAYPNSTIEFDQSRTGGTSILISPMIYLTSKAYLNFAWYHLVDSMNIYGAQDSFKICVKSTSESQWTTIKNYSAPFRSSYSSYLAVYEDLLLDTAYIEDTVQIKLVFHSATVNAQPLIFDNFRVVADISDSLYHLPYHESFDGRTWRPDSFPSWYNVSYEIDKNWRSVPWDDINAYGFKWVVNDDSTKSVGTGPTSDHSGSGNYLYTETGSSSSHAALYSPYLDLSAQQYSELSFWYHMRGKGMGTLLIEQLINSTWQRLDSISGPQQMASTEPWKKHTLLLDTVARSQIRFRIKKNQKISLFDFTQDAAIDDFSVYHTNCPFPNDFAVSFGNITASSANLSWNTGPNAGSYIVEYDTLGFQLGTGNTDTVPSNSLTLLNLQQQTNYDVYIRMLCGSSDTSVIKGPYRFITDCDAFLAPYIETFEDSTIPFCWFAHNQINPQVANAAWKSTASGFPAYGAFGKINHSGTTGYAVGVDGSAPFPLDSISLLSPMIDVSSLRVPEVRMWIFSNNTNSTGSNNPFYLDLYDGSKWNHSVLSYAANNTAWVELRLRLNQFTITGPIRVRFVVDKDSLNAAYFNDIIIDDFAVVEGYGLGCDLPDSLVTSNILCDEATISWNSSPFISSSRIKYGYAGFNPNNAGTWVNNANSPFVLSNLQIGTAYDVFVFDSCSTGVGISNTSFTTDSTRIPVLAIGTKIRASTDTSLTYLFDARGSLWGKTFVWDFGNGNTIMGDTARWTFYQNQTYWVKLTISNGCGLVQDSISLNIDNISLSESNPLAGLKLFPNPNNGQFEVECANLQGKQLRIRIWNESGVPVYQSQFTPNSNSFSQLIELHSISSGLYHVKVSDDQGHHFYNKLSVQ